MSSPFVDHALDLLKKMATLSEEERVELLVQSLQWEFEDGYSAALAEVDAGDIG